MKNRSTGSIILIILRITYVIALIHYLFNGNLLHDWILVATFFGMFISPITYFFLIGYTVFYNWEKH